MAGYTFFFLTLTLQLTPHFCLIGLLNNFHLNL